MAADHALALVAYHPNRIGQMVAVEIALVRHDRDGRLNRRLAVTLEEWKRAKYEIREMFAGAVRLGDMMPPAPKKLPCRQQQKRRAA